MNKLLDKHPSTLLSLYDVMKTEEDLDKEEEKLTNSWFMQYLAKYGRRKMIEYKQNQIRVRGDAKF